MNHNTYKYITGAATTTFAGNELTKVILHGISVNKAVTGTITVKSGSTILGVIAAGSAAGMYFHSECGVYIESLTIVNGSTEDFTVFYQNI